MGREAARDLLLLSIERLFDNLNGVLKSQTRLLKTELGLTPHTVTKGLCCGRLDLLSQAVDSVHDGLLEVGKEIGLEDLSPS